MFVTPVTNKRHGNKLSISCLDSLPTFPAFFTRENREWQDTHGVLSSSCVSAKPLLWSAEEKACYGIVLWLHQKAALQVQHPWVSAAFTTSPQRGSTSTEEQDMTKAPSSMTTATRSQGNLARSHLRNTLQLGGYSWGQACSKDTLVQNSSTRHLCHGCKDVDSLAGTNPRLQQSRPHYLCPVFKSPCRHEPAVHC